MYRHNCFSKCSHIFFQVSQSPRPQRLLINSALWQKYLAFLSLEGQTLLQPACSTLKYKSNKIPIFPHYRPDLFHCYLPQFFFPNKLLDATLFTYTVPYSNSTEINVCLYFWFYYVNIFSQQLCNKVCVFDLCWCLLKLTPIRMTYMYLFTCL